MSQPLRIRFFKDLLNLDVSRFELIELMTKYIYSNVYNIYVKSTF